MNINSQKVYHPALLTVDPLYIVWFHLLSDKVFGKSDGSQVTKTLITAARMYTVSTSGHDHY